MTDADEEDALTGSRIDPAIPTLYEYVAGARAMPEQPDHRDLVHAEHALAPPAKTVHGALAFLLAVIARLQREFPSERVGLLIKTAGENIVAYGGTKVSASRLAYPDHNLLVKILTDVPTTNGPSWQTEEGIPTEGHHGGYLAVTSDAPEDDEADEADEDDEDDAADPPDDPDLQGTVAALARGLQNALQMLGALQTQTVLNRQRMEQINARLELVDQASVKHPLDTFYDIEGRLWGIRVPVTITKKQPKEPA